MFLVGLFSASLSLGQTVSGEWYGVGHVKKSGHHNSYLYEMVLKQKGNKVTGELNYYFRKVEIKTKISGTFIPKYQLIELNARPILNFIAKNENGADCPMEGSFTLSIIKNIPTLTGQFNPTYEYRITCPAIDIKFVKRDPKKSSPPVIPEPEEDNNRVATRKTDTTRKRSFVSKNPYLKTSDLTEEQKTTLALKKRSFDATPVIEVDADSLKIALYDNGEVDNDTVSVFYNRKLVKHKQSLSDKSYSFVVPLDTSINEIAMFAENLGRIPPNTSLAIIYAGNQRFELNLTSTYTKNAAIRFRRKIKHFDPKNIN